MCGEGGTRYGASSNQPEAPHAPQANRMQKVLEITRCTLRKRRENEREREGDGREGETARGI